MKKSFKALSLVLCMLLCLCAIVILAACDNGDGDAKDADDKYNDEYAKYNWVCATDNTVREEKFDDAGEHYLTGVLYWDTRYKQQVMPAQYISKATLSDKDKSEYGDRNIREFFEWYYENENDDAGGYVYMFENRYGWSWPYEFSKNIKGLYAHSSHGYEKIAGSINKNDKFEVRDLVEWYRIFVMTDFDDNKPLRLWSTYCGENFGIAEDNKAVHLEAKQTKLVTIDVPEDIYGSIVSTAPVTVTRKDGRTLNFANSGKLSFGFNLYEKGKHVFKVYNEAETAIDFSLEIQVPKSISLGDVVGEVSHEWYSFTIPPKTKLANDGLNNSYVISYIMDGKFVNNSECVFENDSEQSKDMFIRISCKNTFSLVEFPIQLGYKINGVWGLQEKIFVGEKNTIGFYCDNDLINDCYTKIRLDFFEEEQAANYDNFFDVSGDIIKTEITRTIVAIDVKGEFTLTAKSSGDFSRIPDVTLFPYENNGSTSINGLDLAKKLFADKGVSTEIESGSSLEHKLEGACRWSIIHLDTDVRVYEKFKFEGFSDDVGIGYSFSISEEEYAKLLSDKSIFESDVADGYAISNNGVYIADELSYKIEKTVSDGKVTIVKYLLKYNGKHRAAFDGITSFELKTSAYCDPDNFLLQSRIYYSVTLDLSNDANWQAFVSRNIQ